MQTISDIIRSDLFSFQDLSYRDFQASLMPTVDKNSVIGVRMPTLRKYAKKIIRDGNYVSFLDDLPHKYYEENNLHGLIIQETCDFDLCIERLEAFLPYIDNWATCDMLRPVCFKSMENKLFPYVLKWISDERLYVKRFGIGMLNSYYVNDLFNVKHLDVVSKIESKEYYVNMMIAWYFATVLAFHYDDAVIYFERSVLDKWIHNKAIQKATESYRIPRDKKNYLKTLRI